MRSLRLGGNNKVKKYNKGNTLFNTIGKIMPEMHLKHATGEQVSDGSFNNRKTYSYARPFTNLDKI